MIPVIGENDTTLTPRYSSQGHVLSEEYMFIKRKEVAKIHINPSQLTNNHFSAYN